MSLRDTAGAVLEIDLDALAENYRIISRQAGPAQVAGVIKADGYGLGAKLVAETLLAQGCRRFFVALLAEAASLRPALPDNADIFILNGLQPGAEQECADIGAIPVLNSLSQLDRWATMASRLGRHLPAALQVDTGMSRLGFPASEIATLIAQPDRLKGIRLLLIMSHLASADDPDAGINVQQLGTFQTLTQHFPDVPRSLDNSAGSFLPRAHFDLVRAGIALYGGNPGRGSNPMRPVVSLEARITQLRTVPAGTGVGYELSHHCQEPSHIATIPVGYADGWPRCLGNRGSAFIRDMRVPIIGRVSMDSMTLDVTHVPDSLLYPGAPVELIGPHQSIDAVAADAGTIAYEILTQLGGRYFRMVKPAQPTAIKRSMTA
ncbi:alanine racemase [Sphingobium rhizovicinum]|uniref:Alanine racemase n=1 Tax=Sphingobium rhizovicinum TaxID=432308 RepID=A0ABV7NLJ7_9SPHN